jgi:hypothetical protein
MSEIINPGGGGGSGGLTVGTTTITGGTSGNTLYDNGGILGEQPPGPPMAGANLTWYVNPSTGSDSNPGTSGSPFLTIAKTIATALLYNYQFLYTPTIQLQDGTYNLANQNWSSGPLSNGVNLPPMLNAGGPPVLAGNFGTPGNVVLDFTDVGGENLAVMFGSPFGWLVGGVHISTSNNAGFVTFLLESNLIIVDCEVELVPGTAGSGDPIFFCVSTDVILSIGGTLTISGSIGANTIRSFAAFSASGSQIACGSGSLIFNSSITWTVAFITAANGVRVNLPTANITNPGDIVGTGIILTSYANMLTDVDPPSFLGGAVIDETSSWINSNTANSAAFFTGQPVSGAPTAADLIETGWAVFKDTTQAAGLGITIKYNDAGTLYNVGGGSGGGGGGPPLIIF